jgi:hypothetical protein
MIIDRDLYGELVIFINFIDHTVSWDDVIKTCENLHVEEKHQLKILL